MRALIIFTVFLILFLALFFRVYFSFNNVFSYPIKYSADDGVYHMRIVENLLLGQHFPKRIYFDPFTNFPQGTFLHTGPLYDYLLAFIIWILTFGNPTRQAIDLIAPFYPPVLGTIAVLVVYFLGKALWGNIPGLIAGFFAAISPQLIFRSLLGATDHHVAEYLFSSLAVLFLVLLLKFQEKNGPYSFKWWLLTILTGFSLGTYLLFWEGGLLFLLIFFIFFVFYFIRQYLLSKPYFHILLSGAVISFIVFLFLLPFLGHPDIFLSPLYNLLHIGSIAFTLIFFFISYFVGRFLSKLTNKKRLLIFPFLFIGGLFSLFLIYLFSSETALTLLKGFHILNLSNISNSMARELVAEMGPLGLEGALIYFFGLFFFSLGGLIMIFFNFLKEKKPLDILLIIWFFITFFISGVFPFFGQRKYVYYLWIVSCLFSAFFLHRLLTFAQKGLKLVQQDESRKSPLFPYALTGSLLVIVFIFTFLFHPFPFNFFSPYPHNLPLIIQNTIDASKNIIIREADYYDTFEWLKNNTPQTSLNYYALYKEPKVDSLTKKISPYQYPPDSYGILSRWDLGHAIYYYSQRPVVSNPYQQGIGKKEGNKVVEIGEGVFFTETEEEKAVEYLNALKVRYVVTDDSYSDPDSYFNSIVKWIQGDLKGYTQEDVSDNQVSKFDLSMAVSLHIFDGNSHVVKKGDGEESEDFNVPALKHFRLVYESKTTSLRFKQEKNIKMVKVFEYVKGAVISGKTFPNTDISLSAQINTNQKRKFEYIQKTKSDDYGNFKFIVPYSMKKNNLSVFAEQYKLRIGDKEKNLIISEEDVLQGREIFINF